jgi:NAD(P)-dependent dehydrogenase (short-subunit alcohol dehydrogenase family)
MHHRRPGAAFDGVAMDLQLAGKSVLITGASKGIGLAAARAFAREGCALHLAARSTDALRENKTQIEREHGVRVEIHPTDLGKSDELKALAERCAEAEILVNNAGEIPSGPIDSIDEALWRSSYDVKLFGYMFLAREFYVRMKRRGAGVIINDIGNSGENWDANYIAGSTANAALMAFTKALGGVSLDFGVRVVGVNPGPVETERMVKINKRRALDLFGDANRWEELRQRYPGGRPASAEEVADLMVFLASPRAGYITGTIVTIDGGIAARGSIIKERSVPGA